MVWILGGEGLLGKEIERRLEQCGIKWISSDKDADITKIDTLERFMTSAEASSFGGNGSKIKWIINCAAYTDVDEAESHEEEAAMVNADGATNISRLARAHGIRLIHISTNYVFDGKKSSPYTEDDAVTPINVYGRTKALGEENIAKQMTQFYILRTSNLYGYDKESFVSKIVRLSNERKGTDIPVIKDLMVCPTFAGDAADAVIKLMQKANGARTLFGKDSPAPYGIYHYCASGAVPLPDFAQAIEQAGLRTDVIKGGCKITPCTAEEYQAKTGGPLSMRPVNGEMDCTKISKALRLRIPSWRQSLESFMKQYKVIE